MMNITMKNRGFSMIEVMVALVILAVGILGISKLQGVLIKNSSNANQRTIAVSLAQQKIDDLKSFVLLNADVNGDKIDDAWTSGSTWPVTQQSFAFIANNEGGKIDPADWGNEIVIGNYLYKLDWTVNNFYYPASSTTTPTSTPADETSDYKQVTVFVKWKDESGAEQTVNLATVISAYDPGVTALSSNTTTGGEGPKVAYTPELAPDVIDVDVETGGGKLRQTSKPLPDAVKTGADANTIVSFEVVTYHETAPTSGEFIADINEEFITVDCECQFTNNGFALPPAHSVWDESDNSRYDYIDVDVNNNLSYIVKPTATQVNNANAVEGICSTCCRDHHDSGSTSVKYVAGTANNSDHLHYKADGISLAIQALNDIYVESCRFKRVNGIWRVFQDWKLYDVTTMNREALGNGGPGTLQQAYSNYVGDYVLKSTGVSTITPNKPDVTTAIATSVGAAHQLENRGIYIDKVYDLAGNESADFINYILEDSPVNDDRLEKIPFAEVNLSLLANWTVATAVPPVLSITNEDVATIADPANDYYGTYSRGFINALNTSSGTTATGAIANNNNGITQIKNLTNTTVIEDAISVVIGPAAGNFDITYSYGFSFPKGDISVDSTTVKTTGGAAVCSTPAGNTVICNVAAPWTGDITVTVKVNGPNNCTGILTYTGTNISSDPTPNLAGTCN